MPEDPSHDSRPAPTPVSPIERRTFALDSARMASEGVVNSLGQTVILVVAISAFSASDALKSVLSSAPHLGQLASLFVTAALASRSIRPSRMAGALSVVGAIALAISATAGSAASFTVFVALAMMLFQLRHPFITAIHERNYPAERRGRRFSTGLILLLVVALGFDLVAGRLLDLSVDSYAGLLLGASGIVLVGSLALMAVPSRPAPVAHGSNPFRNLTILKTDRLFRRLIIAWFLMGLSNLITVPLRVVYLAEAERGLGLSPLLVISIGGVIPQVTRLAFSRVWASLFDRMHLVVIRMVLSFLLGLGIMIFFSTRLIPIVIVGQVILNIAFSGGPILWSLWVTRIAPPGRSSIYMSVHTFMTGIRGTIGPALGFIALAGLSFRAVGMISFCGIIVAIVTLLPLRNDPRGVPPVRNVAGP